MARFFIDRPVLAWVISIVIVIAGLAAVWTLPVAQYPEIAPPTVQVTCQYAGASAVVVADTVAAPIEQQVNGVENMLYMSSQSANDGTYSLTVTFKLGTSLDMAQVLVQNRVSQAMATLPDVVKATGVTVKKRSPSILLVVNLYSDTNPETKQPYFDQLYLSNYATIDVKDELARLAGVGDVVLLGQQDYSMRVWLDPNRLASRNLTADDVVRALREQNVQVAAGQLGQPPAPTGLDFQYTMTTLGRLKDPLQFGDIVVKAGTSGELVRLHDVARIERGAKNQDVRCQLDGKPSVGLAIFQLPGSNALDTADRVQAKMEQLRRKFKHGLAYAIVYDTTPFVEESVAEVFHTLRDAVILVAIVILIFLQDWKSVILPLIDIAVSLVGTFAVMYALGFTLNNLTLFGLVLAIGIVVDDAIVVLENIERWLAKGLPVREATIGAMGEITGPIIAMTLVMCSVFLPSALIPGISGQFYRQFALTIAASMILSAINAMTMTPARATAIFKDRKVSAAGHMEGHEALPWWGVAIASGWISYQLLAGLGVPFLAPAKIGNDWAAWFASLLYAVPGVIVGVLVVRPVNAILGRVFQGFNWLFDRITNVYGWVVGRVLRVSIVVLLVYVGLIGLTYLGLTRVPTGFIPEQDKGYLVVNIQLPDSSSLERTMAVTNKLEAMARAIPGVQHTMSIPGQSFVFNANSSNFSSMFVVLEPFHDRRDAAESANRVAQILRAGVNQQILEAVVAVFGAPPVDGLGNSGGFKLMVQDVGDAGLDVLQGQADNLAEQANRQPGLVGVIDTFRADTPQLYVDVNRTKCKMMGVALSDVFNTLQYYLGGYYVNDFNEFGRTWQVNVQAESPFRMTAAGVKQLRVRNADGDMIPLGTVADIRDSSGPVTLTRYNMRAAAGLNGAWLPGVSSGQAISTMEQLADSQLASTMAYEWTDLTFMEKEAGGTAVFAFAGAVVLVFLVLSAQYESWSMPLAVILVMPMCVLCSIAGVALAHMDINIFVQVGFVVLVGLAAKNAILVVEFAREAQKAEGISAYDATILACKTRLRPIIMTSFAFILGVVPLVFATGAGAEMRRTLGTAVFSGMLGVTGFGLFLTPVFYYVIERLRPKDEAQKAAPAKAPPPASGADGHAVATPTATPTPPAEAPPVEAPQHESTAGG
ncbi:MAG: efflux RND transporter permease subunit [Pirellulales bacterium]